MNENRKEIAEKHSLSEVSPGEPLYYHFNPGGRCGGHTVCFEVRLAAPWTKGLALVRFIRVESPDWFDSRYAGFPKTDTFKARPTSLYVWGKWPTMPHLDTYPRCHWVKKDGSFG